MFCTSSSYSSRPFVWVAWTALTALGAASCSDDKPGAAPKEDVDASDAGDGGLAGDAGEAGDGGLDADAGDAGVDDAGAVDGGDAGAVDGGDAGLTPETYIDGGLIFAGYSNAPTQTFIVSCSTPPCSFACAIDDAGVACDADGGAYTTPSLAEGTHTFTAQATNDAGATDPTPASRAWTIDFTRPTSSVTGFTGAAPTDAGPMACDMALGACWAVFDASIGAVGVATDNLAGLVAVEVSFDNGGTWTQANGTTTWDAGGARATRFATAIRSRATDNAGNEEVVDGGLSVYTTFLPANAVLGNTNSLFDTECMNDPGDRGMNAPEGIAVDLDAGRLFVADSFNNRILVYAMAPGTAAVIDGRADFVLGQFDFLHCAPRTAQAGLDYPTGLGFDPTGNRLWVADTNNNRVVAFDTAALTSGAAATFVLGQANFSAKDAGGGSTGMYGPRGVAVVSSGNVLHVSDSQNNRVLMFPLSATDAGGPAAAVLGQANFTTVLPGSGATGFDQPIGLAHDAVRNLLFVADSNNHRILVFTTDAGLVTTGADAGYVLGQPNLGTADCNTTAHGLCGPLGVEYDQISRRLFVSDNGNARVLVYNLDGGIWNGIDAGNVLGQNNFETGTSDGTFASTVSSPRGLAVAVASGLSVLYVADVFANRVVAHSAAPIVNGQDAGYALGHFDGGATEPLFDVDCAGDMGAVGLQNPSGIAIDAVRRRLFVGDSVNNRVLVFNLDTSYKPVDNIADAVIGQRNFRQCLSTGPSATSVGAVRDVAVDSDAGRLFVVDSTFRRVLVFNVDAPTLSNGMDASAVLGQVNFTSNEPSISQARFVGPQGLAYDSIQNRLFVSDIAAHRVLTFNVASITNGQDAGSVIGQVDFTSVGFGSGATQLNMPQGLAFDSVANRLFVVDRGNMRVMVFNVATVANGADAGAVLGVSSFAQGTGVPTRQSFDDPFGATVDPVRRRLFVGDQEGARIVMFDIANPTNGQGALNIIGQPEFESSFWGITAQLLASPSGLALDPSGARLYASDFGNNRVLLFDVGP
ncbi:MAG: hypothetical protein HYY84_10625 [Deltaproteobacteria bacterium]|nr:hypothetical protein [Deltaproteobacteria bacterium]